MPKKAVDENVLSGLEKQVDELVKNIDDVLKAKVEDPSEDNDMTGAGADNEKDWKGKGGDKKHTNTVGSTVRNMVGKAKAEDAESDAARLAKAAELLGIEPAELEVSMLALEKAKAKPFVSADEGDDELDDGDEDDMPPAKKAAAADSLKKGETVVIEGEVIAKADVGEAVFNVLQKQSEKIGKQADDIKKAQDEAEMERLRKRADSEYAHVPGTTEDRALMLKALGAMPKPLQQAFGKVLANSEKITKDAFSTLGFGGKSPEEMQKTRRDFETKVSEIAKRDSCTRQDAMSKARKEDPEGFNAYQGSGN